MKILAIESSGLVASAAIWQDGVVLAEYTVNFKKTHSQTLLPMIDEIISITETPKDSFDVIAVSSGPGSFTGLRIGSATAKGLALAWNLPIASVPTLDVLAYQCFGTEKLICPIMDARRSQVYTGLYRFSGSEFRILEAADAESIDHLCEKLNNLGEAVLFLGDGVPVYEKRIRELCKVQVEFCPSFSRVQRAAVVAELGAIYAKENKTEPAWAHSPQYLRVSQAERERAERLGISARAAEEGICYRVMVPEDVPAVSKIEEDNFSMPWKESDFLENCTRPEYCQVIAEKDGKIAGYAIARTVLDEGEIATIAVKEEYRGVGIGGGLLKNLKKLCLDRGVTTLHLEVRESNAAARALYEKNGFTEDGKSCGFYEKPREDAVLMSCVYSSDAHRR